MRLNHPERISPRKRKRKVMMNLKVLRRKKETKVLREEVVVVLEVAEVVTESMVIERETMAKNSKLTPQRVKLRQFITLRRVRDLDMISQRERENHPRRARKTNQRKRLLKRDQRLLLTQMLRQSNSRDGINYFDVISDQCYKIFSSYQACKHIIYIHS